MYNHPEVKGVAKAGSSGKTGYRDGEAGDIFWVFVPTSLNVLSISMFLRFGFILGQSGYFGMMG